jgi:hypothetical protein
MDVELLKTLAPSKLYRHSERIVPFKDFVEELKYVNATGQNIEMFFKKHEIDLEKKRRIVYAANGTTSTTTNAPIKIENGYSTKQLIGISAMLIAIGIIVYKIQ